MAKKRNRTQPATSLSRERIRARLTAAEHLEEQGRPEEALAVLSELADRYPQHPEVLEEFLDLSLDLEDMPHYQEAAARLLVLRPDNGDLALAEARGALLNVYPATTLDRFQRFLARWPEHPEAPGVREQVEQLERALPEVLALLGLDGEEGCAVALEHERVQHLLSLGRFREVRQAAWALHARAPGLMAALNNLGMAAWSEGDFTEAGHAFRQVLESRPDNVHALSNLARLLASMGRGEEARALTDRLKASSALASDRWLKVAEALTFLGDDVGVLDALARAEAENAPRAPASEGMLRHLAAVAAARQGDTARARRLWEDALRLSPQLAPAEKNLEALDLPRALRPMPWAFPLEAWVAPVHVRRVRERLSAARGKAERHRTAAQFLETVPGLRATLPLLLDRGDPGAVRFALELCGASGEESLLEAVERFALGERGAVRERAYAALLARDAGRVREEDLLIWTGERRQPFRWFDHELYDSPERRHSRRVESLGEQALLALRDGWGAEGERLLREALALEPDSPDLVNNLAVAYQLQGRVAEGTKLAEEIFTRWPNYFFGRCAEARRLASKGRLEEARHLLEPLLEQRRLHTTELSALCAAHVELLLAEGDREGAQVWLSLMESTSPEDRQLPALHAKVSGTTSLLKRLSQRLFQGLEEQR